MAFISKSPVTFVNTLELASNAAYTAGQLVTFNVATGAIESATTTSTQTLGLFVNANAVTSAAGQIMSLTNFNRGDIYIADAVNNSNAAHNGQRMIITAGGASVTNTGTDVSTATGVVTQIGVLGLTTDKKILVIRA